MPALFSGIRPPSTLGLFLRAFTWGNVLQLEKASRLLLGGLARRTPLLPGADALAFVDIDSMQGERQEDHARQQLQDHSGSRELTPAFRRWIEA
jgi:hypothetical protein